MSEQPSSGSTALRGRTVWLTRPESQGESLAQGLRAQGAKVFSLPLLVIRPLEPDAATAGHLRELDRYDFVIFISSNAARIGLQAVHDWWPQYPVQVRNFAVGPGTAAVIESFGLEATYPREAASSEALLALPELQAIEGRKVLIVRGVGGRELLAQTLRARGAGVDYAELYQRATPAYDATYLRASLREHAPHAVVVSSGEALDSLRGLFEPIYAQWRELPLYVTSARLQSHAGEIGFTRVAALPGAAEAAIIDSLSGAMSAK